MAKLCSYYPLHFMQAVIIVNPRGLLYHVRGSREENGVGWCMANWKCHSYLFISTTRPFFCACVGSRTRIRTHGKHTCIYIPGCPLAPTCMVYIYLHINSHIITVNHKFTSGKKEQKHTETHGTCKTMCVLQNLHLKLLP